MSTPHTFHIPVMGTGFTLDTPLRVGRYGIRSVVSLGDDGLIELARRHWAGEAKEAYEPIPDSAPDARARRITAYLDLLQRQLQGQARALAAAPEPELNRYFRLLPDGPERAQWLRARGLPKGPDREAALERCRAAVRPAPLEANIMAKVDRSTTRSGKSLGPGNSDACAAVRGLAACQGEVAVVISAGFNPRLFATLCEQAAFFPDEAGLQRKQVILKVNDYRSAEIQGKYLAKRGVWVAEWRVESGLNCGGHAFGGVGALLGPTLEEFKSRRQALAGELFSLCQAALLKLGRRAYDFQPPQALTAQGGVGTADEHAFLLRHYGVDSVGWGTPFLLVPEAVRVDEEHLRLLSEAGDEDIELSDGSPLGVPFWRLRTSASERQRRERVAQGRPGSPCPQAYLTFDTSLTKVPVCMASRGYQTLKLRQIEEAGFEPMREQAENQRVKDRGCICLDLGAPARQAYGGAAGQAAVCPGPNLANFSLIASLEQMLDHIYGRAVLPLRAGRPHHFIKELMLELGYLERQRERSSLGLEARDDKRESECLVKLRQGIEYYRGLAAELYEAGQSFLEGLEQAGSRLQGLAGAAV